LRVDILAPTKEDVMSSTSKQEPLTSTNVALLNDVLRSLGFRGVDADASADAKRAASIFIYSQVRNGNTARNTLLLALGRERDNLRKGLPLNSTARSGAVDRWRDEGGQ
jgi:hypothetical protein